MWKAAVAVANGNDKFNWNMKSAAFTNYKKREKANKIKIIINVHNQ